MNIRIYIYQFTTYLDIMHAYDLHTREMHADVHACIFVCVLCVRACKREPCMHTYVHMF